MTDESSRTRNTSVDTGNGYKDCRLYHSGINERVTVMTMKI